MKRKTELEVINRLLWIILIILLIILFNVGTGKSQEYDCKIATLGVLQYSTLDSGKHWDNVFENRFLYTTLKFQVGYDSFQHTIEDITITYKIQPNSIKFDTVTMHMSLIFCNDWSNECQLDIWFKNPKDGNKGDKVIMKWNDGIETNLMIFEMKDWELINVPLDLQIKRSHDIEDFYKE